MLNYGKIEQINIYLPGWAVRGGKYQNFKVETKQNENDVWSECWSEDAIPIPSTKYKIVKHVVKCR